MKIYFTASIAAKEGNPEIAYIYSEVVKKLRDLGHQVDGDHVIDVDYEVILAVDDEYRVDYYKKLLKRINAADLVFAELTYSSASIGHEVSLALEKNKPVVVAAQTGTIPQVFLGVRDPHLYFMEYATLEDLLSKLEGELENVREGEDIRFNFLIPPSMVDYLEWISRTRRIPKSVFLRDLISREIEKDKEYQER